MIKGIIKFSFQKIISEAPVLHWDKYVFDATWMEYKMQAANYNQQTKETLFTNLLHQNPNAIKLHDAVSTAAIGYLQQLKGIIPALADAHAKEIIPFKNFKFNIIQSDMIDIKQHKVEIIFISEPVTLIDVFNNHYLIAVGDKQKEISAGHEVETILIPQTNHLSILSFSKSSL
jgi:hypothetical protein